MSVEADYDCANNPFDTPPTIRPGTTLSSVKLYLNDTTGPYWDITYLKVLTTPMKANVKEELGFSFTGKAKGSWSFPTGSA